MIPGSRPDRTKRLDPVGTLVLVGALVALFYPLIEGRQLGWPAWSIAILAAAAPLLSVFVLTQTRHRGRTAPLVDLSVFRSRASPRPPGGSASGVVSTVTQLGSVVAVTVTGVIFFGTLGGRPSPEAFVHATSGSLWYLSVSCAAAAVGCGFLPSRRPALSAVRRRGPRRCSPRARRRIQRR